MALCTGKFGVKEGIHDLHRQPGSGHARTHCQNVGIVVQAGRLSAEAVSADCRTDPFITVSCDGNADAGTTDQNPAVTSSFLNLFYYFLCIDRIVYCILRIRTTVGIFQATLLQMLFDFLHQTIAGLITTQC